MSGATKGKLGVGRNGRAGERISLVIEPGQLNDLEHVAESMDRSVSWCVRAAVTAWLAAQDQKQ